MSYPTLVYTFKGMRYFLGCTECRVTYLVKALFGNRLAPRIYGALEDDIISHYGNGLKIMAMKMTSSLKISLWMENLDFFF